MSSKAWFETTPRAAFPLDRVPVRSNADFQAEIGTQIDEGGRVAALFAWPDGGTLRALGVIADSATGAVRLASTPLEARWESMAGSHPQVELFEREMAEQWGIQLVGHPWPKPVRYHAPWRGEGGKPLPAVTQFFQVEGEDIHEVAVGPVHAGVIEPGHFRFQCYGEEVIHLEIALGFQHRGVERALIGGNAARLFGYLETAAGDSTIAHSTAGAEIVEALTGITVPHRGAALRAVMLELERMANHVGDLGAFAGDVGFLPTASFCGRLRGDVLNLSAALCGSRFGRGMVRAGGVRYDADATLAANVIERVGPLSRDLYDAIELMWDTPGARARFEDTGAVSPAEARKLGLVGVAARAAGYAMDARADFPGRFHAERPIAVASGRGGDVQARGMVRWEEVKTSLRYVPEQLATLPDGPIREKSTKKLAPSSVALSTSEAWRGEAWHVAITDERGEFARYKIVDPSFHNWSGLAFALRGQAISDFPLCNKSFNLSYCGFDL